MIKLGEALSLLPFPTKSLALNVSQCVILQVGQTVFVVFIPAAIHQSHITPDSCLCSSALLYI